MKKYYLLIVLGFLILKNLSAQECGYIEYHPLVEAAAEDYSNKKYKAAKKKLELAFTKVDFPLGKDLGLALSVAQKSKDSEWAERIAIKLAKGGVPLRYFVKQKKCKWYEKFKADFQDYSEYYNENYNPEVREKLISLLKRDKEFNAKFHQWKAKKIEMTLEELIDGAYDIYNDLIILTDKYGFPNERLMGYNYVYRKNKIDYYPTDALIIHIYQRGELVFKNKIRDIVCDGGLHPNYEEILKQIRGFGDSTGIEQEMKIRYEKFRKN